MKKKKQDHATVCTDTIVPILMAKLDELELDMLLASIQYDTSNLSGSLDVSGPHCAKCEKEYSGKS